jgi:hypothetical protein
MRSSFIAWFHKNENAGIFDLDKTRAVMRQLHQLNLQVHLGYNKFKSGDVPPNVLVENLQPSESDSD